MEWTGKSKHKLAKKLSNQLLLTKASWQIEKENMVSKTERYAFDKTLKCTKLVANQATIVLKYMAVNS